MKTNLLIILLLVVSVNSFANKFYIDPVNGSSTGNGSISSPWKTLENVINQNLIESKSYVTPYDPNNPQLIVKNSGAPIKVGDTLMLYSGMHGIIDITNYINDDYISVMNVSGNSPILKKLHVQAGEKWIFQGAEISSEPYGDYLNDRLVFLETHSWQGPVSDITIKDCFIYSTNTAWQDSTNWVTKASDGIYIKGDSISIINNTISNIRFGISMSGDYINVSGNTINNFSGDGIRLLGSNNIVEKNIIKNCYAVDNNHDDGIQSFTTGGVIVNNNTVRQNIILNYEDPNQPLLGDLQGMGCFDGPFYNWQVENNLVIVNHWHGISFYGFINSKIINNTVLDPTPNTSPGPSWIKIEDISGYPSSGCVVQNNVTNAISVTSNTVTGNNTTFQTLSDYSSNFVDYANNDFHILPTSSLIDAADSSIAPNTDIEDSIRPSGPFPDIGAYEYQYPLFINTGSNIQGVKIYPNPFISFIDINGSKTISDIKVFNINGKLVKSFENIYLPTKLDLGSLNNGIYFIQTTDVVNNKQNTKTSLKISN